MIAALYPSKKVLKASVGKPLVYRETSWFGPEYRADGDNLVVGPDERKRAWFATVTMRDGKIVRVR